MGTPLAVVASGGKNQRTLFGLDVGRDLGWAAVHAEAALYEGAEMFPPRDDTLFFRVVAGALRTSGENAFALEYFYNGEGYSDGDTSQWLSGLDRAWSAATNPALPPPLQEQALALYAAVAYRPDAEPPVAGEEIADPEGLVIAGLQGMIDPPRDGVLASIEGCQQAGIPAGCREVFLFSRCFPAGPLGGLKKWRVLDHDQAPISKKRKRFRAGGYICGVCCFPVDQVDIEIIAAFLRTEIF